MAQAYLNTTIKQTGKVEQSGPFDLQYLKAWVEKQKEMHPHEFVSYEIEEIVE